MPQPVPEGFQKLLDEQARRVLVQQVQVAFWSILLFAVAVAASDIAVLGTGVPFLHAVNLILISTVAAALVASRYPGVEQRLVSFTLLVVAAVCVCFAAAGIARHDATTMPVLGVMLTIGIGTAFAWGVGAQVVTVAVVSACIGWNVYVVRGEFGSFGHASNLAFGAALIASVWLAHRRNLFHFDVARQDFERQQADARRATEERFAALVEHSSDIVLIIQADGVVRFASPAVERVLGYTPDELKGQQAHSYVHPEDLAATQSQAAAIAQQPRSILTAEFRCGHKRGHWVHIEAIATNLLGHPDIGGIVVHARDITDRKRAEQEKDALLEVAGDITGTLDLTDTLQRVQRRLSILLPCDRVTTFLWDTRREVFRVVSHFGVAEHLTADVNTLEFPFGHPVTERLHQQERLVVNDINDQEWFPADFLRHFNIGALVAVPLVARGRLVGAFNATRSATDRPFLPDQVRLFEGIARQVAVAIATLQLYEAQQADAAVASALARVGQELISSLNTPELLERLCRVTTAVMGCDASHTYVLQQRTRAYAPVAGYGDSPEQWQLVTALQVPDDVMAPLLARFEHEDVIEVYGATSPDVVSTALRRYYGVTLAVYMALRHGTEVFGIQAALYRERQEPLSREQYRIAHGVVQLASMALENARLVEELERANRFNSDFVANMSHELRTPLNVIIGYHDLLLDGVFDPLTAAQGDTIHRADRSARELLGLVNATLDLSRFEARPVTLQAQEVVVAELLEELGRETRSQLRSQVEFRWSVPPRLPPLHTDALKLKMVLKNLVGNAAKFTERGSINVAAAALDGGIEFSVSDTGMGIAPEAQSAIFEPFRQAADPAAHHYGGVGLGLYIVRRLLEMVGGRVMVESDLGRGATFRVWIPNGDGVNRKV